MTSQKLLFDENFGGPIIRALTALSSFHKSKPIIKHLLDEFPQGTKDPDWVPKMAAEKWILITADRGQQCGGAKLPKLCEEFKITHLLVSRAVHKMKQFDKVVSVLKVFDEILRLDEAVPGSRYHLRCIHGKIVIEPRVPEPPPIEIA